MSTNLHTVDALVPWLDGVARNDTSQFGEDGLIEAVFARIGTTNRWCFEAGASDGLFFSNTKRLRDDGWHAVLVDNDAKQYVSLKEYQSPRVHTFYHHVEVDSLDRLLSSVGAPSEPDLGVIDVDGQDWWIWNGLIYHSPRVMLVEIHPHNSASPIPLLRERDGHHQAGLDHIVTLGTVKGYTLVARTHCNALFVRSECLSS